MTNGSRSSMVSIKFNLVKQGQGRMNFIVYIYMDIQVSLMTDFGSIRVFTYHVR